MASASFDLPLAVGPAMTMMGGMLQEAGMAWVAVAMAPEGALLDDAIVARLATRLKAGPVRRLGPDAAEMVVAAPDAEPGETDIDWAVLPARGRRKRLLIADMDSTMVAGETLDELAVEAGIGAQVAAITARAMNGDLDFEAAVHERVGLLAGLPVAAAERVLSRLSLMPGAGTAVATMQAAGAHCMLVSGGFTLFAEPVGARLGFDEVQANRLDVRDGRLTGRVLDPVLGRDAKRRALEERRTALGLAPEETLAVGDGANDLAMLGAAGLGVAFRAKPAVASQARVRVSRAGLAALLYLQGYTRAEFAA